MPQPQLFAAARAAALVLAGLAPAAASDCDGMQDPSPPTRAATGVAFTNDTPFAMRVHWSDFDGELVEYALVQPFETARFRTYVDHLWYVEVISPQGSWCLGPVSAVGRETCAMRILFDGADYGLDGGFCDY